MMGWFNALMQRRLVRRGAPLAILVLIVGAIAAGTAIGTTATCNNPATLTGSAFEIDTNANLKVDTAGCIDWLADGTGSSFRSGVLAKNDSPSGANDESFGQGTAEDNPNPTVVTGSIPPNKSDLKAFGVYTEEDFLELFWSRVQNPSGTTNMDFELNKEFCDGTAAHCANNGTDRNPLYITPKRTVGDKLIIYDLSRGGTVPTISIRTWTGSAWGPATLISGGSDPDALGSVNTTTIPASETGGLGQQDPFTFGEAAISFEALFGQGACGTFGSAYLKSRSSDSFTSEIKDFVPPERVNINNCPTGLTTNATASVIVGEPISDTATLSGGVSPTGTITFHLFPSLTDCQNGTNEIDTGLTPVTVNGNGDYNSGNFTPTATGTYYWVANYSGDGTNDPSATACDDANEQSVVSKAPSTLETAQSFYPNDSATVSATAGGTPSGDVTFTLFDSADCSGTVLYGPVTSTLDGNGVASTNNTTVAVSTSKTVSWKVEYPGDTSHNPVSSCVENTVLTITNGGPITGS
jgi:hypothetical protein